MLCSALHTYLSAGFFEVEFGGSPDTKKRVKNSRDMLAVSRGSLSSTTFTLGFHYSRMLANQNICSVGYRFPHLCPHTTIEVTSTRALSHPYVANKPVEKLIVSSRSEEMQWHDLTRGFSLVQSVVNGGCNIKILYTLKTPHQKYLVSSSPSNSDDNLPQTIQHYPDKQSWACIPCNIRPMVQLAYVQAYKNISSEWFDDSNGSNYFS